MQGCCNHLPTVPIQYEYETTSTVPRERFLLRLPLAPRTQALIRQPLYVKIFENIRFVSPRPVSPKSQAGPRQVPPSRMQIDIDSYCNVQSSILTCHRRVKCYPICGDGGFACLLSKVQSPERNSAFLLPCAVLYCTLYLHRPYLWILRSNTSTVTKNLVHMDLASTLMIPTVSYPRPYRDICTFNPYL